MIFLTVVLIVLIFNEFIRILNLFIRGINILPSSYRVFLNGGCIHVYRNGNEIRGLFIIHKTRTPSIFIKYMITIGDSKYFINRFSQLSFKIKEMMKEYSNNNDNYHYYSAPHYYDDSVEQLVDIGMLKRNSLISDIGLMSGSTVTNFMMTDEDPDMDINYHMKKYLTRR